MTLFRAPVVRTKSKETPSAAASSSASENTSLKPSDEALRHSINDLLSASTSKDGSTGITYSPMAPLDETGGGVETSETNSCGVEEDEEDEMDENAPLKLKIKITERKDEKKVDEGVGGGGIGGGVGGGGIYCKDDQDRFSQQYTVKLKTFTEYDILVEIRPPHLLDHVQIGNRTYTEFEELKNVNASKSVYMFVWSTRMIRVTKRKHRTVLPFSVKLHQHLLVNFDVFVKFYYSCEVEHYTGIPLTFIEIKSGLYNGTGENGEPAVGGRDVVCFK